MSVETLFMQRWYMQCRHKLHFHKKCLTRVFLPNGKKFVLLDTNEWQDISFCLTLLHKGASMLPRHLFCLIDFRERIEGETSLWILILKWILRKWITIFNLVLILSLFFFQMLILNLNAYSKSTFLKSIIG